MFGILDKMDRFSNCEMGDQETIDFIQEIVDNGMVWKMHEKYIDQALFLMGRGKVVDMGLRRIDKDHTTDGPCFQECCIETEQPPYRL